MTNWVMYPWTTHLGVDSLVKEKFEIWYLAENARDYTFFPRNLIFL